ncbi:MAG: fluoride efflux transporter CrcB [Desulfitobacterium hafniense]|nr:fluoride efflux transporter CrcB [Desulfitobacterium hafniense]
MQNIISIAIGGALGALSRYELGVFISTRWNKEFPIHTFLINVSGAFLLGFLNTFFLEKYTVSPYIRMGIGVGFLGAYTTFSTFGYETIMLIKDGSILTAALYTGLSVLIGFIGVVLGIGLARLL